MFNLFKRTKRDSAYSAAIQSELQYLWKCEQILRDYIEHQRKYDHPMTATEVRAREELYWLDKHRIRHGELIK